MARVLIVDDDPAVGAVLEGLLQQGGMQSAWVASGQGALEELSLRPVDAVVSDVRMPGLDGMQLLQQIGVKFPGVPVILMTAHASVPLAVEAMKNGAADFVTKPFDKEEILYTIAKAMKSAQHAEERAADAGALLGESEPLQQVQRLIDRAAQGDATVLLRGESGTGKELAARALHERGRRKGRPFVKVHCAALPDALLESELFGYEKGAFTGAASRKPGRVELAEGGTLFLDEIGDITPATQVKLLRLLQDKAFERLGGTASLRADVRFVSATHRDLEAMVKAGQFREDLFYRLNVVPIWMPPLRERPGDVARLARHFCASFGKRTLSQEALERLCTLRWPGNVRQLQNFVERLTVLSDGAEIGARDVERELAREPQESAPGSSLEARKQDAERDAVKDALARAGGNRTQAARLLGISRRTLYTKLEEYGLG